MKKNLAASIQARLLALAKSQGMDFKRVFSRTINDAIIGAVN